VIDKPVKRTPKQAPARRKKIEIASTISHANLMLDQGQPPLHLGIVLVPLQVPLFLFINPELKCELSIYVDVNKAIYLTIQK
jgi:hypothetical protein